MDAAYGKCVTSLPTLKSGRMDLYEGGDRASKTTLAQAGLFESVGHALYNVDFKGQAIMRATRDQVITAVHGLFTNSSSQPLGSHKCIIDLSEKNKISDGEGTGLQELSFTD
ncbi:hypothetical protein EVAR_90084_1 [Eumeta japonica]|uniref:Uncharacterized protein n=1 Tax=Eumeta variegata TaxID=151549 RepID=A0A4C1WZU3_EUMVA|nr:hypothetical protein EVAR_90084_1 [Eumeta japonica]